MSLYRDELVGGGTHGEITTPAGGPGMGVWGDGAPASVAGRREPGAAADGTRYDLRDGSVGDEGPRMNGPCVRGRGVSLLSGGAW